MTGAPSSCHSPESPWRPRLRSGGSLSTRTRTSTTNPHIHTLIFTTPRRTRTTTTRRPSTSCLTSSALPPVNLAGPAPRAPGLTGLPTRVGATRTTRWRSRPSPSPLAPREPTPRTKIWKTAIWRSSLVSLGLLWPPSRVVPCLTLFSFSFFFSQSSRNPTFTCPEPSGSELSLHLDRGRRAGLVPPLSTTLRAQGSGKPEAPSYLGVESLQTHPVHLLFFVSKFPPPLSFSTVLPSLILFAMPPFAGFVGLEEKNCAIFSFFFMSFLLPFFLSFDFQFCLQHTQMITNTHRSAHYDSPNYKKKKRQGLRRNRNGKRRRGEYETFFSSSTTLALSAAFSFFSAVTSSFRASVPPVPAGPKNSFKNLPKPKPTVRNCKKGKKD